MAMNFNAPICPLLHLFLSPLPLPSLHALQHHHLHPVFPEGRIKRWGSCVYVCVRRMCECKVVVRGGGGCISHFPAVSLSHNCPHLLLSHYTSPSPLPILLSSSVLPLIPLLFPLFSSRWLRIWGGERSSRRHAQLMVAHRQGLSHSAGVRTHTGAITRHTTSDTARPLVKATRRQDKHIHINALFYTHTGHTQED